MGKGPKVHGPDRFLTTGTRAKVITEVTDENVKSSHHTGLGDIVEPIDFQLEVPLCRLDIRVVEKVRLGQGIRVRRHHNRFTVTAAPGRIGDIPDQYHDVVQTENLFAGAVVSVSTAPPWVVVKLSPRKS